MITETAKTLVATYVRPTDLTPEDLNNLASDKAQLLDKFLNVLRQEGGASDH
jgi:hypothetical protein